MAFKLYDTYGLSLDIVEDVAREEDLKIDTIGYEKAMDGQRTLSQESWKGSGEEGIPEAFRKLTTKGISSRFVGYEDLNIKSRIVALVKGDKDGVHLWAACVPQLPLPGSHGGVRFGGA